MILTLALIAIVLALTVATLTARKDSRKVTTPIDEIERPVEGLVPGKVETPEESTNKQEKESPSTAKPKKKATSNTKPRAKDTK